MLGFDPLEFGLTPLLVGDVALPERVHRQRDGHEQRDDDQRGRRLRQPPPPVDVQPAVHAGPALVEHLFVDRIADLQQPVLAPDDSRELEPRRDLVLLLVGHARTAPDGVVGGEHGLAVERLPRQHVADELQVGVAFAGGSQKQIVQTAVHGVRRPRIRRRLRQRPEHSHRQIGVAARPPEDPVDQVGGPAGRQRQATGQRRRFLLGEVGELDAVADIERRARRVLDQIVGGGDADEDERDPLQLRVQGPGLIEKADRRVEVVGEIEAQRRVDLVDEEDQPLGPLDERDFAQIPDQPMRVGVFGVLVPPGRGICLQPELLLHQQQKTLVPLVGRGLRPELGQIDDHRTRAGLGQLLGGAVHEARFPHLPRGQDVGEVTVEAVPQQVAVRVALQVDTAACLDGSAGDELERVNHRRAGAL